jgi:hypothetical protein
MSDRQLHHVFALALSVLLLAACAGSAATPTAVPAPTAAPTLAPTEPPPTLAPSPTATPLAPAGPKPGYWEGSNPPASFNLTADGTITNLRLAVSYGGSVCTIGIARAPGPSDSKFRYDLSSMETLSVGYLSGAFDGERLSGSYLLQMCNRTVSFVPGEDQERPWSAQWKGELPTATPTLPPASPTATAPAAMPAAGDGTALPTALGGGVPTIPHDLQGRETCLVCHNPAGGLKPAPPDHLGRTDDMCQMCHKPVELVAVATPASEQPPAAAPAVGTVLTIRGRQFKVDSVAKQSLFNDYEPRNPAQDTLLVIQTDVVGVEKLEEFQSVDWRQEVTVSDENGRESKLGNLSYDSLTGENVEHVAWVFVVDKTAKEHTLKTADGKAFPLASAAGAPASSLPTYAQVASTYPAGVELSCTNAEVSDVTAEGDWVFTGGVVCPGKSQLTVEAGGTFTTGELFLGKPWKSYGAKITVKAPVTIDGKTYPPGAMLTVDKDLNWVQVSSLD